jgi:hypothetical protein
MAFARDVRLVIARCASDEAIRLSHGFKPFLDACETGDTPPLRQFLGERWMDRKIAFKYAD